MEEIKQIAAYDASKQKLIGVFSTITLASRYLFPTNICKKVKFQRILYALANKIKIFDNEVNVPIALRMANSKQIEMLGEENYIICGGYEKPKESRMGGFTDSRFSLWSNQVEVGKRNRITNRTIQKC